MGLHLGATVLHGWARSWGVGPRFTCSAHVGGCFTSLLAACGVRMGGASAVSWICWAALVGVVKLVVVSFFWSMNWALILSKFALRSSMSVSEILRAIKTFWASTGLVILLSRMVETRLTIEAGKRPRVNCENLFSEHIKQTLYSKELFFVLVSGCRSALGQVAPARGACWRLKGRLNVLGSITVACEGCTSLAWWSAFGRRVGRGLL